MPKFKFSLETLLRHREDTEQRERDELLRLNYKHQVELNHRHSLTLKFQETMHEISRRCEENTLDQELNWSYAYLNRLTHEIKECENRLKKLKSEVLAQQAVVIEAAKKRKALASMKSKQEKEFVIALEKQEQKEIDDLVVTRYAVPGSPRDGSA
ncbi:MAG: flagellar FliJ family protein [Acidobacteriota bacterium]|nr:flagellar FliJ family protein [Acidobacteriota bacterium]